MRSFLTILFLILSTGVFAKVQKFKVSKQEVNLILGFYKDSEYLTLKSIKRNPNGSYEISLLDSKGKCEKRVAQIMKVKGKKQAFFQEMILECDQ